MGLLKKGFLKQIENYKVNYMINSKLKLNYTLTLAHILLEVGERIGIGIWKLLIMNICEGKCFMYY